MKKLLLLFTLFLCSFAHAQLNGVDYYFINTVGFYERNSTLIEVQMESCWGINQMEFTFTEAGDYFIDDSDLFPPITSYMISSNTFTIELNDNGWFYNGERIGVYNDVNELMFEIELYTFESTLESIAFESNPSDSIIFCSSYGQDCIDITYNTTSGSFRNYCMQYAADPLEMLFFLNNKIVPSNDLSSLEIKTGDSLQVKTLSGPIDNNATLGCIMYQHDDTLSTGVRYIKVLDNEVSEITDVIEGSSPICPGETLVARKKPELTLPNYRWVRNYSRNSFSFNDSINITRPGNFLYVENTKIVGDKCPKISFPVVVNEDIDCKAFVSGKVLQEGTNEPIPGITVTNDQGVITVSDENGYFEFYSPYDDLMTYVKVTDPDYYNDLESVNLSSFYFYTDENENLYTYLIQENDLSLTVSSARNRPGFTIPYYAIIENRGKNELVTNVSLTLDDALTYTSLEEENSPTSVNGQDISWSNISVPAGETVKLKFFAILDRATALGTVLNTSGTIDLTDDVVENNTYTYDNEVTGSFDPNDKLVNFAGFRTNGFIYDDTDFSYTIRFQNTGTDTAFTVRVVDKIDEDFDLSTFNMIDASHDYTMSIKDDTVTWVFNNILLPDSNINEPESHGFIRFSISQKAENPEGTVLSNKAWIYFDFNDPIVTNETMSVVNNGVVTALLNPTQVSNDFIKTYPNPCTDYVKIGKGGSIGIYDSNGIKVLSERINKDEAINITSLIEGIYYFELIDNNTYYNGSFVKQ